MDKASEYREHAKQCRALAEQMKHGEHRAQLLAMAETWERLAQDRTAMVEKHPELMRRMGPQK
jgi:hypothetical protein